MICLILLLSALLIVLATSFKSKDTIIIRDSVVTKQTTESQSTSTRDPFGHGPWDSEILSDAIVPSEYNLNIRLFSPDSTVDHEYSYGGDIFINALNTVADNNVIVLHAVDLIMAYPTIYLLGDKLAEGKTRLNIVQTFMYEKNNYYVIILGEKLAADSLIQMNLQFERKLDSDESKGFFMRKYVDEDAKTKLIMATNFKESNAKKTFPCFEDTRFKVDFNLALVHREDTFSISNTKKMGDSEVVFTQQGEKFFNSTFQTANEVSTNMISWLIVPLDFGDSTILGYVPS